jgi:hypothetical protein
MAKYESGMIKISVIEMDPVVIEGKFMRAVESKDASFARRGLCDWFSQALRRYKKWPQIPLMRILQKRRRKILRRLQSVTSKQS